jgi:predicted alpha/beta hydrolase
VPDTSTNTSDAAPGPDAAAAAGAAAPEAVNEAVTETALAIPATDGFALAATCFCPPPPAQIRARVIIGPATGVLRRYYAAFARALAARGFEVITLDYRGIGDSAPPRLRGFEARMHDWGALDLAGALRWAFDRAPGLPVLFVGHSVAGQVLPTAEGADRLAAILLVGAQAGNLGSWTGRDRLLVGLFWRVVVPVTTGLLGRLPGWAMGGGEDLPAGVAREWARWGLHPDYLLGEHPDVRERAGRITVPTALISFEDDFHAPRASVDLLASWYGTGGATRCHIHPRDVGARAIGHFGCFRPAYRDTLWARAMQWLERHAQSSAAASGTAAPQDASTEVLP